MTTTTNPNLDSMLQTAIEARRDVMAYPTDEAVLVTFQVAMVTYAMASGTPLRQVAIMVRELS
jgi:hypothetical protein